MIFTALIPLSLQFQATSVSQWHGPVKSPYSNTNSLSANPELKTSVTSTIFLGANPFEGFEAFINPELAAGSGLSSTHGVAGYPNGEIYRVDNPAPRLSLARAFVRYTRDLGGSREPQDLIAQDTSHFAAQHQRFTVTFGKFSLNDTLDDNTYSHDPRTQFLNWSLMDNGAWDYAADTRGYTWALQLEYKFDRWTARYAAALVPKVANGLALETNPLKYRGDNIELEYRYNVSAHPAKIRALVYHNQANMGSYQQALAATTRPPDITSTRSNTDKTGLGLNLENELTSSLGLFSRLGWNDGQHESFAYTEVDRTASAGVCLKGTAWKREQDMLGGAFIINALSGVHTDYLHAGGMGFLLGDGDLGYSPEQIWELYYAFQVVASVAVTADYQLAVNPGYNHDRGPASIVAGRLHYEF